MYLIGNCEKVGKSKIKSRVKSVLRNNDKQSSSSETLEVNQSLKDMDIESEAITPPLWHHRKKYWFLIIPIILLITLVWFLSQQWAVQTYFSQVKTYPKISVLGENVGNLDAAQLNIQLAKLKLGYEAKKVTLVNGETKWTFDASKLGLTFDANATSKSILRLNKLSFVDKYRLSTGDISSVIVPTISVDSNICAKTLSAIPSVQVNAKDASLYYDQGLKIHPDQSGNKFNVVLTCKELSKRLTTNSFTTNVSLDIISANLTKADLEAKLSYVQSLVGQTLSLKSGNYKLAQTPEQLFALLDISKQGSNIQINWSSTKLDNLVNSIAAKVNTYDSSPTLGGCQKLVNVGGNSLNKTTTKEIFTHLGTNKSRSYTLPVAYHAAVVNTINPIAYGNKGTIYLTFDDGLTYGNQIMNYAACYGIKITFFEIGERVGTDAAGLRRAIAEGHAVQSHGHYHAMYDYGDRSYDWQYNDMKQSITDIMNVTGVRPTYFRPPGGNRSATTYTAAATNGLKVILWGDASRDSTVGGLSSAATCANVLAGAYPGASVLMHSIKQSTANAVPCIVEGLAARGYNMQALR
jgi:peptidoglycan/xylan/chitin deacetylase (PgdA/CDA1 family)